MPHKDPEAAKACKKAYYLANREKAIANSRERRIRLAAENAAANIERAQARRAAPKVCTVCGGVAESTMQRKNTKCANCKLEADREYRAANAAAIAAKKKAWKLRNAEHVAAKDRRYADENPDKRAAARARWEAANPGVSTAAKANNRLARKKRVPTWLTEDDRWIIAQAYELAQLRTERFGFAWHVDHIIPLNGKKVSGLHVPNNIRVIPGAVNMRKHNSFEVDA
jgi:hypothetical protein